MYILGAGISGLILGYKLNSPVYGLYIGGQMRGFTKGPRILEVDEASISLLKSLGIKAKPRAFTVGYLNDDGLVTGTATEEERANYYLKTRGREADVPPSVMSGGNTTIIGWDINEIELVDNLIRRVDYTNGYVDSIDFSENKVDIYLGNGSKACLPVYDGISTINLRTLSKLIRQDLRDIFYLTQDDRGNIVKPHKNLAELDLSAYDTEFVRVYTEVDLTRGYDYLYCTGINTPINRITRIGNNEYCIEFRSDVAEIAWGYIHQLPVEALELDVIRFCQLRYNHNVLELGLDDPDHYGNRLKLCGRFARWQHSIKINDIIREADEYAKSMGG